MKQIRIAEIDPVRHVVLDLEVYEALLKGCRMALGRMRNDKGEENEITDFLEKALAMVGHLP